MSSIDAAVVVDVTRLQRVFARLQFVGGGKDLTRSVASSLLSSSEMAFEQEKEPDGERWHDWSDPY
ncbi:phage virion morphogenesis protein, partial [Escherichia coli]|nr:phage virion morphogenesis protein [Escherichia coli]